MMEKRDLKCALAFILMHTPLKLMPVLKNTVAGFDTQLFEDAGACMNEISAIEDYNEYL